MDKKSINLGRRLGAVAAAFCLLGGTVSVSASIDVSPASCYWYDTNHRPVTIPDAYELSETVELSAKTEHALTGIVDSFVADDGTIYVLDASGAILLLDAKYQTIKTLDALTMNGESVELNAPEGLFVDADGVIYVADTLNYRIVKLDSSGNVLRIFEQPDNLTGFDGELDYLPSKLVVDSAGRIFVVVRNVNMGIVVLDKNGQFITYRGAPSVTLSLFDLFWRRFSTQAQRDRMTTYVPTEYNNITIDGEDFLYGTISSLSDEDLLSAIQSNDSSGKVAPLKKLNLAGEDILRRQGMYPPVGDLASEEKDLSSFTDVALSDCGIYTVLDANKGRLFTYNDDGELLFAFGGIGQKNDSFSRPVSLGYSGDALLVFDGYSNRIYHFIPTAYGELILTAVKSYYNGDYDTSYACWGEVLDYNSNLSLAYVGVGKAYYREGSYNEAMECFRIAGDVKQYSAAYRKVRDGLVRTYFGYLAGGVIVLAVVLVLVGIVKRFQRYRDED